jgi:hypothetical protein
MTWTPPADWQESLRDALSAAAADRGMSMHAAGVAMGQLCAPTSWTRGDTLPNVRSLVAYCAALGVRPSDLLREAGL